MSMTRSDIDAVTLWCRGRVPEAEWKRHRLEAEVTERHIDLVTARLVDGSWHRTPIARLRFMGSTRLWMLHWRDAEGSFNVYRNLPPVRDVREILEFLAGDSEPLFWG